MKRFPTGLALVAILIVVGCVGPDPNPGSGLSSAKALTAFSLVNPVVQGVIDASAKTVALDVPSGTDVTSLVADFTTTGASVAVGSTPQVSGTTPNDFSQPVVYTVKAEDGTTADYTVTATVQSPTAKKFLTFNLASPARVGAVDESAHTVTLDVPPSTDLTTLVPTFTFQGASVKVGATTQTSGVSSQDFTSPVTYTVVAADASTQDYVVTVTPFTPGTTAVTLNFNRITGEPGRYGVYLWVEDSSGNFVKTLSYYIDWGSSSTSGAGNTASGGKFWYIGTNNSDGGSAHLAQSLSWRTKSGVTANSGAVDVTTAATLGLAANSVATSFSVTYGGGSPSLLNPLRTSSKVDEYFPPLILPTTGTLPGWDGTDANGDPVAKGNYSLRMTVSRKANDVVSPVSPYFTEYRAPITVGSSSGTTDFSPVHVVVSGGVVTVTAAGSSDEVSVSNGPVLASSTVTYTP